jgi:hypothetical protein
MQQTSNLAGTTVLGAAGEITPEEFAELISRE